MKPRSRIYVTRQIPQGAFDILLEDGNVSFWNSHEPVPRGELLNNIQGVDALLCMPTDKIDWDVLDRAGPSLKVIGTLSELCNHIDVDECKRRNIQIITMPSISTEIVADLTVAALEGQLMSNEDVNANESINKNDFIQKMYKGKTLGLIGLGSTAVAIGKRLRGKGISDIKYSDFTVKSAQEKEIGANYEEFEKVLEDSDIICICCRGNNKNSELFYKDAFQKMKKSAILIDAARGHVINYYDLYEALREQHISAAAVDLREQGKIPYKDQLLGLNNCIFVPYQESNRWDKRSKISAIVSNKIVAILQTPDCIPENRPVSG